jgi:hypothetical protein
MIYTLVCLLLQYTIPCMFVAYAYIRYTTTSRTLETGGYNEVSSILADQ